MARSHFNVEQRTLWYMSRNEFEQLKSSKIGITYLYFPILLGVTLIIFYVGGGGGYTCCIAPGAGVQAKTMSYDGSVVIKHKPSFFLVQAAIITPVLTTIDIFSL